MPAVHKSLSAEFDDKKVRRHLALFRARSVAMMFREWDTACVFADLLLDVEDETSGNEK